jgi:hypothetical protein
VDETAIDMIKYAHIGYPKSGSTWLQHSLFPAHPQLHHLGRSNGDCIIDDEVRLLLWNDLCFTSTFLYDPQHAKDVFQKHFDQADRLGKTACGISQETFTAMILGGTDIVRRAERLCGAMGADTRIIMVVRNPLTWIRSLYTGQLKEAGMVLTYEEFLSYFYYDQDVSPYGSLFYDQVYDLYCQFFGQENVHVIPFEWIKSDCHKLANAVCDAIGVEYFEDVDTTPRNTTPTPIQLSAMLDFNRRMRFGMGGHRYERPWAYTILPRYRQLGHIPKRVEEDKKKSRFMFCASDQWLQQLRINGQFPRPMDVTMPQEYVERFSEAYGPHMRRLQIQTGLDLESLGYPAKHSAREQLAVS